MLTRQSSTHMNTCSMCTCGHAHGGELLQCIIYKMLPLTLVLHLASAECQERGCVLVSTSECVRACLCVHLHLQNNTCLFVEYKQVKKKGRERKGRDRKNSFLEGQLNQVINV